MSTSADSQSGQCECGQNTFEISGEPLFRSICHCEICQEFNNALSVLFNRYYSDLLDFLILRVSSNRG
jgi:hypothetical protein